MVHNLAAYAYALMGNSQKAEDHIKRYMELEPDNSNVFDSGFEVYTMLSKPTQALAYIEKGEQLSGRTWLSQRTRYYLTLGKPEGIQQLYQQFKDSADYRSFQEMLPLSLVLQGKFKEAVRQFDILISRFEKNQKWNDVLFLQVHKGITLMAGHQYPKAIDVFEKTITVSQSKLQNRHNPCLFLSHYYAGVAEARQNNLANAQKKLLELNRLLGESSYDSRFKNFVQLLEVEILLANQKYQEAKSLTDAIGQLDKIFSVGYLHVSYTCDWGRQDFNSALKSIVPFDKNYIRSAVFQGGDPAHFAWERAFSDYTTARIYEDAGNKKEAMKYYKIFLERFKDSDHGIYEKEDAEKRIKDL